jgi:hypothetical protein
MHLLHKPKTSYILKRREYMLTSKRFGGKNAGITKLLYQTKHTFPEAFANALTISNTDVPFPDPRLYGSHPA